MPLSVADCFIIDYGTRSAYVGRDGLRIGYGFECVSGWCSDVVSYRGSGGGGCGVGTERSRSDSAGGADAGAATIWRERWVHRTWMHSRQNVW